MTSSENSHAYFYLKLKLRVYRVLEGQAESVLSWVANGLLIAIIFLNVLSVALETVQSLWLRYQYAFHVFELFSVAVFTIEYVLRLWSCTANKNFRHPLWGRLRFIFTPLALIDLLAILPFYLPIIFPDLRFMRAIRFMRIFRVFKLGRYSSSFKTLGNVLKAKKESLIITFFMVLLLLVMSASLIYFVEHEAQPQAFSNIPTAMWWAVVTLTTVGYGDVYPVTSLGKVLGSIIAVLGIGLFALPAGIIASGFADELNKREARRTCPHCGKSLDGE